jgi:hypothetical protein
MHEKSGEKKAGAPHAVLRRDLWRALRPDRLLALSASARTVQIFNRRERQRHRGKVAARTRASLKRV